MPNTLVRNRQLASDIGRQNMLVNGGLEIWQRGNGPFTMGNSVFGPDRWQGNVAGGSIVVNKDTTNNDLNSVACASCAFTVPAGMQVTMYQKLEDFTQLRGKVVTFSARVKASTASAFFLTISTQAGYQTYSPNHSGNGQYQTLSVSYTVLAADTAIYAHFGCQASITATAYLDNAMFVVGTQSVDYVPLTPADEWTRCQRYYQRWAPGAGTVPIGTGYINSASGCWMTVALQSRMAGNPTVTFSALSDWGIAAGPTGVNAITSGSLQCYPGGPMFGQLAVAANTYTSQVGQGCLLFSVNANSWLVAEFDP